jgi:hypothetical protein
MKRVGTFFRLQGQKQTLTVQILAPTRKWGLKIYYLIDGLKIKQPEPGSPPE